MTIRFLQCLCCKHLDPEHTRKAKGELFKGYRCKAFPGGIPEKILDDILFGRFIHDKRHPEQDNDIIFEKLEVHD